MSSPSESGPSALLRFVVLLVGLVAISHGAIFVRLADAPALVIAAYRVSIASAVLVPFAVRQVPRTPPGESRTLLLLTVGSGLFLALHFATWIASLELTTISNSLLLVNTNPIWIALLGGIVGSERPSRREWTAVLVSVLGMLIIGSGSLSLSLETLRGDALALCGGLFLAGYLLLGRRVRQGLALLPYTTLCYGVAALALWSVVLPLGLPAGGFTGRTWVALVALALVPQTIGHTSYNWALRSLRPGFVAICLLGEPIVGSLLGLLLLHEGIPTRTLAGGSLILVAILLAAREP